MKAVYALKAELGKLRRQWEGCDHQIKDLHKQIDEVQTLRKTVGEHIVDIEKALEKLKEDA